MIYYYLGKYLDRKKWYDAAREVMQTRTQGYAFNLKKNFFFFLLKRFNEFLYLIKRFYAEQINFVLLAITKDRLSIKKERVRECIYLNRIVEGRLNELNSGWRADEPAVRIKIKLQLK